MQRDTVLTSSRALRNLQLDEIISMLCDALLSHNSAGGVSSQDVLPNSDVALMGMNSPSDTDVK